MPPVVAFKRVFILPIALIFGSFLPEHQIHKDLLEERKTYVGAYFDPLLVIDALLVDDNKMSHIFGEIIQAF